MTDSRWTNKFCTMLFYILIFFASESIWYNESQERRLNSLVIKYPPNGESYFMIAEKNGKKQTKKKEVSFIRGMTLEEECNEAMLITCFNKAVISQNKPNSDTDCVRLITQKAKCCSVIKKPIFPPSFNYTDLHNGVVQNSFIWNFRAKETKNKESFSFKKISYTSNNTYAKNCLSNQLFVFWNSTFFNLAIDLRFRRASYLIEYLAQTEETSVGKSILLKKPPCEKNTAYEWCINGFIATKFLIYQLSIKINCWKIN